MFILGAGMVQLALSFHDEARDRKYVIKLSFLFQSVPWSVSTERKIRQSASMVRSRLP